MLQELQERKRTVAGLVVFLFVLGLAAWFALDALEEVAPETVKKLKSGLVQGFGVAIAVLIALVTIGTAPWWVGLAAAGAVLVGSGAWRIAADALELGGGGGTSSEGCNPGEVLPDGGVCLGLNY